MTYFLKKKKWMAWVVLLTFLFTSFMPSNILAGNSVAEAGPGGSGGNQATGYNLYFYGLIPGETVDSNTPPDNKWYGLGVGKISGDTLKSPANYNLGQMFSDDKVSITQPSENPTFPDLTYKGKTYQYAAPDSKNKDTEGYYTLKLIQTIVSAGTNTGANEYNPTIASGTKTFHRDYSVSINETDYCTVNFMVQEPDDTFRALEKYAQRVEKNSSESKLKQPSEGELSDRAVGGITYTFDGWYTDQECTTKANFNGTITQNTDYYGKYVPKTASYKVEHYLYSKNANDGQGGYILAPENINLDFTGTETKTGMIGAGAIYSSQYFPGWKYDADKTKFYSVQSAGTETELSVAEPTILADGSLVIRLYYDLEEYTVSYEYTNSVPNAPKVPDNETYNLGDTVTIAPDPVLAGYTFHGWTATSVQEDAISFTMPASNVILQGYWTPNTDISYVVEYETADGEKLLEDKAVTGQTMANTVTETAEEIAGYTVDEESKSLKLEASGNVITFIYTPKTDISYTVEYRLRDENGRRLLPDKTVPGQTMASTVIETAEEIAGYTVDEESKSLKLEASGNKIVFLYNVADGTGYTVERYYQNLDGSYSWFETITGRTTTTSHLAFLEDSDKVWSSSTTPGTYVFNPNAEGTVDRLIVAADGSTVLKAFFDLRVKVQYYYTDGTTAEPKLIAETAPLYKLGSAVNVPLMDGLLDPNMDFSNLWYTDATIKNSWNFDTATISGDDLQLIDGQYVLVLYTSAKVKPLATGDVVVQKIVTGNAPAGEVYNFTMDITANTPNTRPQLGDNEASQLNLLTTAEIQSARAKAEAEGQWESAKEAFKANALQVTTDSGLKFVMADDRNNTLFGITSSSTLAFDYDAYTTFTFEGDAAEESLLDQIISFFQGLTSRPDKDSLVGLRDAVVTSGSALSFHVSDADNVYTTYQAWQKAEKEHATAAEELYKFQVNHGLIPSKVKVQVTDQDGNMKEYTLGTDVQADENGVYTLTFGLKAGDSRGFKFIAATGSAITFDIHENYSNDSGNFLGTNIALGDQENIIARDSQAVLNGTTGSQYIFINNFRPVDGGNGDGGGSTGGGDSYDGPYSDDPSDDDTIIDDGEVPLAEPDVDDTDDGIEIDDGEVPLTDVPGEALEIDDEQVPLGDAPKTGDANNAIPFVVLMMMAGLGLAVTRRKFN